MDQAMKGLRESNPLARIDEVRRMLRQHSIGSRTMGEDGYPLHAWVEDVAAALERVEAATGVLASAGYHDEAGYYWSVIQDALKLLSAPAPAGERSEG